MTIDQTPSELRLRRSLYVVKFLRALILHVVFIALAVPLYFGAGLRNVYPTGTDYIHMYWAMAIEQKGPSADVAGYAIGLGLGFLLFVILAMTWMYRAITQVRKTALRVQAILLVWLALSTVYSGLPMLAFAFDKLDRVFAVLASASLAALGTWMSSVGITLWKVSGVTERSSFLATLDPRLAPSRWAYVTKLLDLPRTPLRTFRTAGAFLLALAGAVLTVACLVYLLNIGHAGMKLQTLVSLSKQVGMDELQRSSDVEARRILWLLPCALLGVKVAALFQSLAKKLGGLSVSEVIRGRDDRYILYLRPFDLDEVILPKPQLSLGNRLFSFRPFPVRIEEELFDVADGYRPLIAVGKPGRTEVDGGLAYRAYLDDSQWREYVAEKIKRADRIVMVVKETDGVRWEFERVLALGAGAKTLFFFHPEMRDPVRWHSVAAMVASALKAAGMVAQDFRFESTPIGFYFRAGEVVEIVNANWSATSYRTAFSHFLAEPAA